MGSSQSKAVMVEDDVMKRCRERKRFIKLAIQNREALADAHVAYLRSLKTMGTALRQVAQETETIMNSSTRTSPAATSEFAPAPAQPKSTASPGSSSRSHASHHSDDAAESPTAGSSLSFHGSNSPSFDGGSPVLKMNYMRSGGSAAQAMTFEEKPPTSPATGTVEYFDGVSPSSSSRKFSSRATPPPPQSQSSSWDIFNVFGIDESAYSYFDNRGLSQRSEGYFTDSSHIREEEEIPDLEDDRDEISMPTSTPTPTAAPVAKQDEQQRPNPSVLSSSPKPDVLASAQTSAQTLATAAEQVSLPKAEKVQEEIIGKENEQVKPQMEMNMETPDVPLPKEHVMMDKEAVTEETYSSFFSVNRDKSFLGTARDIEELFIRTCEAGKEVAKMLEATKSRHFRGFSMKKERSWKSKLSLPYQCMLSCFKGATSSTPEETPSKALTVVSWHQSATQTSSLSNIHYAACPRDDVDDSSSDFMDDSCMISGSHASSLERLLAWEKKLFDEVKGIDSLKRDYDKKCVHLRHLEAKAAPPDVIDKTRVVIKDLHSRIRVAIHSVDSVSKRIQKLRDDELQPQLLELIEGFLKMWRLMLDCHQSQHQLIRESNSYSHVSSSASRDAHRRLSLQLESELTNWQTSFGRWVHALKNYVQALYGWLQKCILLHTDASTRSRQRFSPRKDGAPPVVVICSEWSKAFEHLHETKVIEAIRSLVSKLNSISVQLDISHNHERNADIDNDNGNLLSRGKPRSKLSDGQELMIDKSKAVPSTSSSKLADTKDPLESFRKRAEEEGLEKSARKLQDVYVSTLRKGLADVFESLTSFASDLHQRFQRLQSEAEEALVNFESVRRS